MPVFAPLNPRVISLQVPGLQQVLDTSSDAVDQRISGPLEEGAQPVNPLEDIHWDSRLACASPFFHRTAWAKVLEQTYGYQPRYFTTRTGQQIEGLLPVMEIDSWLTGRRGVSLPFTDCCQPLARDRSAFEALFNRAVALGQERRWKYLEVRGGEDFLDSARVARRYLGHEVDLRGAEQALFGRLSPPVRRAVRKAKKHGLNVEFSKDFKAMRQFYDLQCMTRRKHGLPPQPFAFFQNLQKHVLAQAGGVIVLAGAGSRIAAGAVFLHAGDQAIFKFGASDERMLETRGNDLVMWEGIKYCAAKGFRTLHLGRSSLVNEGLRRFKLGWGAREHPIDYFKYDLRKRAFVTARDEAFGWYNRVFSALPPSLSRLVGALLYRHIA